MTRRQRDGYQTGEVDMSGSSIKFNDDGTITITEPGGLTVILPSFTVEMLLRHSPAALPAYTPFELTTIPSMKAVAPTVRRVTHDPNAFGDIMAPEARAQIDDAIRTFAARTDVQDKVREIMLSHKPFSIGMGEIKRASYKPHAYDALMDLLANLGLSDEYARRLPSFMGHHDPILATSIAVVRDAIAGAVPVAP